MLKDLKDLLFAILMLLAIVLPVVFVVLIVYNPMWAFAPALAALPLWVMGYGNR